MLIRWNDLARDIPALGTLRRGIDRLVQDIDRIAEDSWQTWERETWPALSLEDTKSHLSVRAELPGVSPDDIEISLDQDLLTVCGVREATTPAGYSVHRRERPSLRFRKSISLPCKVNSETARADASNGIVKIAFEKVPESRPRTISVVSR